MRRFTRYFSPDVIKATLDTTPAVHRLDKKEKHLFVLEMSQDIEEEMMGITIDDREPKVPKIWVKRGENADTLITEEIEFCPFIGGFPLSFTIPVWFRDA